MSEAFQQLSDMVDLGEHAPSEADRQGSSMMSSSTEDSDYPVHLGDGEDWALERESEINRLEKENEELRKLLGIDPGSAAVVGATEDEWAGVEPLERRRLQQGGFRGGSITLGRKPSLLASRAGSNPAAPTGFALQNRAGSLGWLDKPDGGLLSRQ